MAAKYNTRVLPESRYDEWLEFVSASPEGSIYAVPDYLMALSRADGGRVTVLGVHANDELVGGIALYERESRLGLYVGPRPLHYYNGVLLRRYNMRYPSEQTARGLKTLDSLECALRQRGHSRLMLASPSTFTDVRTFVARGWKATPRFSYVVDLSDMNAHWHRVEQNLRRLVSRCQRDGVTFHEDGDFNAFFRLHSSVMTRKNHAPYLSEPAFRSFFEDLRSASLCRLFEARNPSGRVIASQLVLLGPAPICHIAAAATDEEAQRSGVTAFLRWKSFEVLSALGYTGVDLTDAALNPVTHFKSQLGGELRMSLLLDAPQTVVHRMITSAKDLLRHKKRDHR